MASMSNFVDSWKTSANDADSDVTEASSYGRYSCSDPGGETRSVIEQVSAQEDATESRRTVLSTIPSQVPRFHAGSGYLQDQSKSSDATRVVSFGSHGNGSTADSVSAVHTESLLGFDTYKLPSDQTRSSEETSDYDIDLDDKGAKAFSSHGNIDIVIHRASIKSEGLPDVTKYPKLRYEDSLVSNYTDLGAQGLRNAYQSGSAGGAAVSSNLIDESEPIQERLLSILEPIPGHSERKGFFPRAMLDVVINEKCVREVLEDNLGDSELPEVLEDYARKICGISSTNNPETPPSSFKKIFVTLVFSERIKAMPLFIAENVSDEDLPLHKVPSGRPKFFTLGRRTVNHKSGSNGLACFRKWPPLDVRKFEEWQWTTLAPFFHPPQRKDVAHFILPDQSPLPFTEDSRFSDSSNEASIHKPLEVDGGYSSVFKVNIHPEHHAFHNHPRPNHGFAIKCLFSKDRQLFQQEAATLMKFSGDAHKHLISLLATYEQFNRFYLVFPWAEADLRDYWSTIMPKPTYNCETIIWVASQCLGLAHGLLKIHKYESSTLKKSSELYGRHGDIKPENVLWFRDDSNKTGMGTLKITDFGLTEFSKHSKTYKSRRKLAVSPSYRPPECDFEGVPIGRSYDIWTLGCLYLEMISWLLGRWNLVEEFQRRRTTIDHLFPDMESDTFFEPVRGNGPDAIAVRVKCAVVEDQFILDLHAHVRCSEYLHEFLQIIQMDMLVVKRPDQANHERLRCDQLYTKLSRLHKRCEGEKEFAAKPCPWTRRPNDVKCHSEAFEVVLSASVAQTLKPRLSSLPVHDGRHILLADSPAVLRYREISRGGHITKGTQAVPRAAVRGMPVVEEQHEGRDLRRSCVQSFTTPF